MCGIAGIMNLRGVETEQIRSVYRMANRMIHRGPDDEGFVTVHGNGLCRSFFGDDTPVKGLDSQFDPGYPRRHVRSAMGDSSLVALGHRRLSIIDLSPAGHQPMSTEDLRYWVVYNGEIYNFREISHELETEGLTCHGKNDTEVLVKAYARWGENCLYKFNGMFAFVIWDNRKKILFCARDRIGIKPFYYTIQDGQFIFASDIKTIIASGLYQPEVDSEGLYYAMALGMSPRPKTAFKDLAALEQGHWIRVHGDGRIEKQRYWMVPVGKQERDMTEIEAVELLEKELVASVKRRLLADVPVGTFMSGGIDSTTISAIASGIHPGIKAFTLGYHKGIPELDEVKQAVATAALHPMEHIIHRVNPIGCLDLRARIEGYEEPCYGLAANYMIAEVVRDNGIKVILNGLGGDELFAGYTWYGHIDTWRFVRMAKWFIDRVWPFGGRRLERLQAICRASSADRLHTVLFSKMMDAELQELFSDKFLQGKDTVEAIHDMYVEGLNFTDDVEAFCYLDLINYVGNHHVHRGDQFTMAHSIEARCPMLDHKLVEVAFRIPSRLKIRGRLQKYVLRKVAEKYIAPGCLSTKKKGFSLPLRHWVEGPLKPVVMEKLADLGKREEIRSERIEKWLQQYLSGNKRVSLIWHLACLEMWFETFIDQEVSVGEIC